MASGILEELSLISRRASYGCVDWYPYYRYPEDTVPDTAIGAGPSPDSVAWVLSRPPAPAHRLTVAADHALTGQ